MPRHDGGLSKQQYYKTRLCIICTAINSNMAIYFSPIVQMQFLDLGYWNYLYSDMQNELPHFQCEANIKFQTYVSLLFDCLTISTQNRVCYQILRQELGWQCIFFLGIMSFVKKTRSPVMGTCRDYLYF